MSFDLRHQDYVRRKLFIKLTSSEGEQMREGLSRISDSSPWQFSVQDERCILFNQVHGRRVYYFDLQEFRFGYKADYFFVHKFDVHRDAYIDRNLVRYIIFSDVLKKQVPVPCLVSSNNFQTACWVEEYLKHQQHGSRVEYVEFWISGRVLEMRKTQSLCRWEDAHGVTSVIMFSFAPDQVQILLKKIQTRSYFRALTQLKKSNKGSQLRVMYLE